MENEGREMSENNITINGVEYVKALAPGEIQIAVLDRGFVYVGECTDEGEHLVIRNARNIRIWGTTKGLGELVGGPTSKTELDPVGVVRVNKSRLLHLVDVDQSKW